MKLRTLLLLACFGGTLLSAQEWTPLFNGKDLSGWVPVNVAPKTFTVRNGIIVSTGKPTGVMRTDRHYENFELELEWKHVEKGGNAGVFAWSYPVTALGQPFTRAIEVQILDGRNTESYTSHGDIFPIHGAHMKPDRPHPKGSERCLPSEWRAKPAGQWNHYRIVCQDGVIKLAVNGKAVSGGSQCTPRKGYICLEAEGTECHFRNIRIKELPSTGATPEETAPLADGFVSIYNGLNLDGWTSTGQAHWKPNDWILQYDGNGTDADLWFNKEMSRFDMIVDWRVTDKDAKNEVGFKFESIGPDGSRERDGSVLQSNKKAGEWNRSTIQVRGNDIQVKLDQGKSGSAGNPPDSTKLQRFGLQALGHPIEFANIYLKELK